MKQVFRSEMNLAFSERPREFSNCEYPFASANGISGKVIFSNVRFLEDRLVKVTVRIQTDRKRMYPSLEAYINLISTVLSHNLGISPTSILNIRNTQVRTILDLELIKKDGDLAIMKDLDGDIYLINQGRTHQPVINVFERLEDAEKELAA